MKYLITGFSKPCACRGGVTLYSRAAELQATHGIQEIHITLALYCSECGAKYEMGKQEVREEESTP